MTLLRDGIKYGAMYGIARQAGKTFNEHEAQKQRNQQQYPQYQQQPPQCYQQQQPPQQQSRDQPPLYQQQPQQFRDQTGYLHQAWCNGSCQSQCNGAPVSANGKQT